MMDLLSFNELDEVVLREIVTTGSDKHFVGTRGLFLALEGSCEQPTGAHVLLEDNRIPGRAHSVAVLICPHSLAKASE